MVFCFRFSSIGGANDLYYNGTYRFNSFLLGVGIPIFSGGQRSRIDGARINSQIAADTYEAGMQNLKTEFAIAREHYLTALNNVAAFELRYLKSAELISQTANKQLLAGTINYLEWVQVTNQAITIQNEYIDVLRILNEAAIQLTYLINK